MRILSRIDGSISGTILSNRRPPGLSSVPSLHGARAHDGYRNTVWRSLPATISRTCTADPRKTHNVSSALTFTRYISSTIATTDARPSPPSCLSRKSHGARICKHTATNTGDAAPLQGTWSKSELLGIVDQYDDTSVQEHFEFLRDPFLRRYAPADGPNLTVSDRDEDVSLQSVNSAQRMEPEETDVVQRLAAAVQLKLKRPATVNLDEVYDLYQLLPEPRVSHITARLRHQLLAVLAMAERKNSESMLRYFAVVTDVKDSGFPLTTMEWNTAISFASRYVGKSTEAEVESALLLWREMEHVAGIPGSDVTFNILFDVASKAGKFVLAEMIYQEMATRGFTFNRYHHVSLIHYFGLRQDTSGVRAAYKEMVEKGELIDSVVLNCVMSSFLRAGEEGSAERVYENMKTSNRGNRLTPDLNYTLQKTITKVLMMFARIGKTHPDMHLNFQKTALISPDLQTYRILVNHYGVKLGDLSKVAQFLDEMKLFNVQLHGSIFLALFKSFSKHGAAGSDWTAERLGSVWKAFLNALDSEAEGLYISTWMAMSILQAFSRYSSRDEILDVYENMRSRWDLDPTSSQLMMDFLNKLTHGSPRLRPKGISLGY